MRIYEASTRDFSADVLKNTIADQLTYAFEFAYGRRPGKAEVASWANSLQHVRNLIDLKSLWDNYIVVEYELPYTSSRIDCLLFGRGDKGEENVVIIELKQWSEVESSSSAGNVKTFVGGAKRLVAHPSQQALGYREYLADFNSVFSQSGAPGLHAVAYCHNYRKAPDDPLLDERFKSLVEQCPVFLHEDTEKLGEYLYERLSGGQGLSLFNRFRAAPIEPSKKLLEHTGQVVAGQKVFRLIDDQLAAYNHILGEVRRLDKATGKAVVLVRGGPGTGKSLIALNVLADLSARGTKVLHATGSKTFTSIIHKIVGSRARRQFQYFNGFMAAKVKENDVSVLLCDEAHRIRASSNTRFTRRADKSDMAQIDELVRAAKVTVFFLDDFQAVRAGEVGSSELIRATAAKMGAELQEFELQTQFRCNGSDGYLSWVNNTLGLADGVKTLMPEHGFDFQIVDSPSELYRRIRAKHEEKANTARLVAGFCWPWSKPRPDGTLVEDVVIGGFKMPWEGKDDGVPLAEGIPPWYLWGHEAGGIEQVGCIYTVQGLEFEYIGVIFGKDLVIDPATGEWKADMSESYDGQLKRQGGDFLQYLKNIYRVLLTRGMRGCYVYFVDKETEAYFRGRIKGASA